MTLFQVAFTARVEEEKSDGYTTGQIAERLDTYAHTVRDWVDGKRVPSPKRRVAIARFLRITPEKLKEMLP